MCLICVCVYLHSYIQLVVCEFPGFSVFDVLKFGFLSGSALSTPV